MPNPTPNNAYHEANLILRPVLHRMRNMLNVLLNTSYLLLDDDYGTLTDEQRRAVDRLHYNHQQLLEIVEALGLYMKAEGGELVVAHDKLSATEVLAQLLAALNTYAPRKRLTIQQGDHAEVVLYGDMSQLKWMMHSLGLAVIHYAHAGEIIIASQTDDDNWLLTLTASEGFIAPQNELLTPQAETDAPSQFNIHVAMVNALTRLLGGGLQVTTHGEGYQFALRLPKHLP